MRAALAAHTDETERIRSRHETLVARTEALIAMEHIIDIECTHVSTLCYVWPLYVYDMHVICM